MIIIDGVSNGILNAVRSYELKNDITFSTEFAKKFIEENFKGKDIDDLKLPFKVDNSDIEIKKITHSIDSSIQSRGNCTFKSSNILARLLFEKISQEDHHLHYKKFKVDLRGHIIKSLEQDYCKIKEQFGEKFVDYLAIKENLQKIANEKFGKKNSKIFKEIFQDSSIGDKSRIDDLSFQDQPDHKTRTSCYSCLSSRNLLRMMGYK